MKSAQQGWLIGVAMAATAGCSVTYQVGTDAPSAGAPNSGGPDVTNQGGYPANFAGAPSGLGGASNSAGIAGNASGLASFCGTALPKDSAVTFASPLVVYQRVYKFLLDIDDLPSMTLPSETTREWAGDLAAAALASVDTPSARGMDRFIQVWWTGTSTPKLWASYFTSRQGTLFDLLTTDIALPNGAGLLTDVAVLRYDGISVRGQFIVERLTGGVVTPPPTPPHPTRTPLMPGETRRSQLEAAVTQQPCRGCHVVTDPYGVALGKFAGDGTPQALDNGLPIDTATKLTLPYSGERPAVDPPSMGAALASSCEVAMNVTRQLLHDATVNAPLPSEATEPIVAFTAAQFTASGLSLPALVRLVVESDTFLSAD